METGIDILGSVPWGTHFCQAYQTPQDVLEVLIPYFTKGLESNDYCLWISPSRQDQNEGRAALEAAIGDITHYEETGQLEFICNQDFFFRGAVFNANTAISSIGTRIKKASDKGYTGLRGAGDGTWLARDNWEELIKHERQLDHAFSNSHAIALCTYLFDQIETKKLIEIMRSHGFILLRRGGEWISLGQASQGALIGRISPLQRWLLKARTENLIDSELIELLLSTIMPSARLDVLLKRSLSRFKSLRDLLAATPRELKQTGIPQHAIVILKLLHELPAAILRQKIIDKPVYGSSQDIFNYLYYSMRDLKTEVFKVMFLDNQTHIIEIAELSKGTANRLLISLRQIMETSIKQNASALIIVHNHPSGDPISSKLDEQLTRELVFAGKILEINVLDHIIIGHNRYFSFADEGLIKEYEMEYMTSKLKRTSKRRLKP